MFYTSDMFYIHVVGVKYRPYTISPIARHIPHTWHIPLCDLPPYALHGRRLSLVGLKLIRSLKVRTNILNWAQKPNISNAASEYWHEKVKLSTTSKRTSHHILN